MMIGSYVVAPARLPDEKDELLALWSGNFSIEQPEARFEWLYGAHMPAHMSTSRGWVLRTGEGALVGAAALSPRTFRLRGAVAAGAQAIDFVIDRQHRTLGPALQLQASVTRSLVSGEVDLAYALPNKKSEPVLIRSGYKRIGALQRWTRPLRYEALLARRLANPYLVRLAAGAVAAVDGAISPELWWRGRGLRFEAPLDFDRRFDELWERAAGQFEMVGERSAAYLTWRFRRHPSPEPYHVTTLEGTGGALLGYVIFRNDEGGLRIADTLAADMPAWKLLMAAFLRRMRRERVSAISILHFGSPAFEDLLRSLGFRRRACDTSVLVHSSDAAGSLPPPASWHLTEADRDV